MSLKLFTHFSTFKQPISQIKMAVQSCTCSTDANAENELNFQGQNLSVWYWHSMVNTFFQVIQIRTRRNCDHNWIHWMGHCDQHSHWFLKLTPLLHVSLVTQMSFASGGSFQDVFCELIGVGQNCPRRKKIKIDKTFNAADDRRLAANKKRSHLASSWWGDLQCIVGEIMDFPDLKTKTSN